MDLIEKVKSTNLIKSGDRIVVGVSGGPDSITLLDILVKLREELNLTLFVVHINHSLRQEADFEEEYVRKFAKEKNIEFFSKKVDINKIVEETKKSTEEVARNIRYEFFSEILIKVRANKIAVAHNLNDSVETVLLNLIRGCGIDGLTGIQKENANIVRPLIECERSEIENYIKENKLTVMHDKTNQETVYTRNKVRNELIPYLKEFNPEIVKSIYKTSKILSENRKLLKEIIEEKYKEIKIEDKGLVLDKTKFLAQDLGLKQEILRKAILEFNGNLVNIGMDTINNAICIISDAGSGAIIKISSDVKIKIIYNKLVFFKEKEEIKFFYELNIPGTTYIQELNKTITTKIVDASVVPEKYSDKNKCFFDIEKTGKKLYVRNKQVGDSISLSGMDGKKSIKKFFSDLKIDANFREKIPLVVSEDDVLWVVGFRTNKKYLKDKYTKEVIIFEYGENI